MHTGLQLLRPSLPAHCGPSCSESALADWQRQLPNALTLARVFALPPFVAAFCSPAATHRAVPAALFAILSVTDLADGYLARKWEVQTEFGAFLDPVADKLLVCTTLILLSATFGLCVALPAIIIVCREIAVSGLREWMAFKGNRGSVAVGWPGKLKTATQMVALQVLLLDMAGAGGAARGGSVMRVGLAVLYVSTLLTIVSGAQLMRQAVRCLGEAG